MRAFRAGISSSSRQSLHLKRVTSTLPLFVADWQRRPAAVCTRDRTRPEKSSGDYLALQLFSLAVRAVPRPGASAHERLLRRFLSRKSPTTRPFRRPSRSIWAESSGSANTLVSLSWPGNHVRKPSFKAFELILFRISSTVPVVATTRALGKRSSRTESPRK